MTTVQEIEKAIQSLPRNEIAELSAWFDEFESHLWDDQIKNDALSGRFDLLYTKAVSEFEAGR
jgi:hypothetical protein